MRLKKRILSLVLILTLSVGMIPLTSYAAVTSQDVAAPGLITSFHSVDPNSPMREIEYYDMSASGLKLTISGKTRKHYPQYRVAIRNLEEAVYLFYPDSIGTPEADNTFLKTLDFSDVEDGQYLVSIRFNRTGDEVFPKEAQMRYVPITKTETGVFINQYSAVERENERVIASNKNFPMYYLDTSMADMAHELRNGREYTKEDIASLTKSQQQTIARCANMIVGDEKDPYMQLLKMHDYLCDYMYYDIPYNLASSTEKRRMANEEEVTLNPYELAQGLLEGEDMKTVCNGFAALYAAMARSLGIPCRSARGKSLRIPGTAWNELDDEQLATTSHVWNEAYVDGRWVFVDVTRDCSNDYTEDGDYEYKADEIVRYSGFDPSKQAIAVAIMYSSYRETAYATINTPVVTTIPGRYEPIELSWTAVDGAVSYHLYRSSGQGYYTKIAELRETHYSDTNLEPGTTYYYKVAAVDSNSMETRKSAFKSVNVTAIPQTEILSASSAEGDVTLQFKGIEGVTQYKIYRSGSKDGTYSCLESVYSSDGVVEFVDDYDKTYGKTYYYKVRGVKGNDKRAPLSESMGIKTTMLTPELWSVSSKDRQVTLRWDETDQASEYTIYRSDSVDGEYESVDVVDGSETAYKSNILTADKKYFWKITATSSNGTESAFSNHKAITVADTPVPELRSVSNKDRSIRLRWYPLQDAVRYYVYRSTDGENYTRITKVSGKTFLYQSGKLTNGKKYYWMVKAVMKSGAITDFSDYKVITAKKEQKEKKQKDKK
ncbi:MAG: hypothetical protein E7280_04155 [Lachnospiraceae bacterium]|nr:hypothetical protein [Lachnospiraceae bacterium]